VAGVIAVMLDAANIACKKRRNRDQPQQWQFARVERVKAASLKIWPDAQVIAVIDASAEDRLSDRRRSDAAHAAGWLRTASGDADDLLLGEAAKFTAPVVSRDNFYDARRDHPWLEDEGRVWDFSIQKDHSVLLRPRRLQPASDEEVAAARKKKARKAGLVTVGEGEVWLCTAESKQTCIYAGEPTKVHQVAGRAMCRFCDHPAREQVYTPPATVPVLILSVDGRERARIPLPADGLVLGRGSPDRSEVADVTEGLDDVARKRIGRRHLRIDMDDDGLPVVTHQSERGYTFLNPRRGADGLPLDNGLLFGEPYPLAEGDTLWLDDGRVKLAVTEEEAE